LKENRSLVRVQVEYLWQKLPHYYVYRERQFLRLCQHTRIMGRQLMRRGTVDVCQHWQKEIVIHWEGMFRKITELLQHRRTAAELNIHLEDPVSTKTVRRELHRSTIHGRAATAKPLITGSNAQMRKGWSEPVWTLWRRENLPLPGFETRPSSPSPVGIPTEVSRLIYIYIHMCMAVSVLPRSLPNFHKPTAVSLQCLVTLLQIIFCKSYYYCYHIALNVFIWFNMAPSSKWFSFWEPENVRRSLSKRLRWILNACMANVFDK
jgi:hypothetical protein